VPQAQGFATAVNRHIGVRLYGQARGGEERLPAQRRRRLHNGMHARCGLPQQFAQGIKRIRRRWR
jgi:hypothetical protein